MEKFEFHKYQGNGNDFIIIDSRELDLYNLLLNNNLTNIDYLCDRHFGIGADGVIFILKPESDNDAKMIIYNSDKSEAEMCGNGIRCIVEYLNNSNLNPKDTYKIETKAGVKEAKYNKGKISVKMGMPILDINLIPTKMEKYNNDIPYEFFKINNFSNFGYGVGMGNPHLIFFVEDLNSLSHKELGPILERNDLFPEKTNVHFCKVIDSKNIDVKVWERGAGETLACGTGACAIHVAAYKLGLCKSETIINLPGGSLNIQWSEDYGEVIMTGNAKKVFKGFFTL